MLISSERYLCTPHEGWLNTYILSVGREYADHEALFQPRDDPPCSEHGILSQVVMWASQNSVWFETRKPYSEQLTSYRLFFPRRR